MTPPRGKIGRNLVRDLQRLKRQKVFDLDSIREGERQAREEEEELVGRLGDYDPSHAYYVMAHNKLSMMVEQVGAHRLARCFTGPLKDAEEEYMPVGPPMSPLTASYFFFWSICDFSPNGDGETLGSATLDVVREIGMHTNWLEPMAEIVRSKMGLWIHEGTTGGRVRLRELVTGDQQTCVVPSGYRGQADEVWLARVLKAPPVDGAEPVAITTPYRLAETSEQQWMEYLGRALSAYPRDKWGQVYPILMKYGEHPRFWPEYIFEAYVNHDPGVVYLTGFPDIAESRPHSSASQ